MKHTERIALGQVIVSELYGRGTAAVEPQPVVGEVDAAAAAVLARLAGHGLDLAAAVRAAERVQLADQEQAVGNLTHPYADEEVDLAARTGPRPAAARAARDMLGLTDGEPAEFCDVRPEWTRAEEAGLAAEILAALLHLREAAEPTEDAAGAVRALIPRAVAEAAGR